MANGQWQIADVGHKRLGKWTAPAFDHALPASAIEGIYLKGNPAANTLSIARRGNSLELTWSFGHLVSSTNPLTGPWPPVSGAISPQLVAPTGAPRFYRTVTP